MNKKNVIKIFTILLIILSTLLLVMNTTCYATAYDDGDQKTYTPQEFTKDADGKTGGGEIKTSRCWYK